MSTQFSFDQTRRGALKCLAFGGAGTLFVSSGGVLAPVDLALGASQSYQRAKAGTPLFVQISDTHTARSMAYPQPTAGNGPGSGPLKVPSDQLPKFLGVTSVTIAPMLGALALTDTTLA